MKIGGRLVFKKKTVEPPKQCIDPQRALPNAGECVYLSYDGDNLQQALNSTQFDIIFVAERRALVGGEKVRRGTKVVIQKKYETK